MIEGVIGRDLEVDEGQGRIVDLRATIGGGGLEVIVVNEAYEGLADGGLLDLILDLPSKGNLASIELG